MEHIEKRKEPRFPFYLPVDLHRMKKGPDQQVSGTINNVSLNGFRALTQTWLAEGERIICSFDIPETMEKFKNEGIIKWCYSNEQHHFGVELMEEQIMALPLQRMTEAFFRLKPEFPGRTATHILDFAALHKKSYSEIFWGMFCRLFNNPMQSQLIRLSSELRLGKFHMKRMQGRAGDLTLEENTNGYLAGLEDTLNRTSHTLDRIIRLFQQLFQEQGCPTHEDITEVIRLNEVVREKVANFKDMLHSAMLHSAENIEIHTHDIPVIFCQHWSIALSIDFLLLFSYQFILFFEAKKIRIETDKKNNHIVIGFANDGSKIFDMEKIHLDSGAKSFEKLKPRDQKRLAALRCVIDLCQPLKAKIAFYNQSGNNLLLLKIPT